jgi:hypothetical protein
MRPFIVAILMAALTVPAYSQVGGGGGGAGVSGAGGVGRGGSARTAPPVDPAKKKAEDKAFNDAVKRIPLPEKKFDPWGEVRETPKH